MRIMLINSGKFLDDSPISAEYKKIGRLKRKKKFIGNGNIDLPPLGLGYMAANIRKSGDEVFILDTPTLQLNINETLEEVKQYNPDVVGVSIYTQPRNNVYNLINKLKRVFDGIIVLGGPHATAMSQEVMEEFKPVNFLLKGEAEYSFVDLLNCLKEKKSYEMVSSLYYRKNGKICYTSNVPAIVQDIDNVPLPARDLLSENYDEGFYFSILNGAKITDCLITSRGCVFQCSFCYQGDIKRRARMRSPESVFQEIKLLHERGVRNIEILDDNFLLNKKRCNLILDKIIESKIDMSFRVRSRVSSADEELWKKMKRAGVYAVSFGMESGSQKMLDRMKKGTKIEENVRAAALTKKYGMMCFSSWVFGMPGESEATIRETENHILRKVKPSAINLMIVLPFPMTPIYHEEMGKGNILGDWSSLHNKYPKIRLENFKSDSELRERVRQVNRKIMFSPYFLINIAKYFIISPNKNMLRYAARYFRNNFINRIFDLITAKKKAVS